VNAASPTGASIMYLNSTNASGFQIGSLSSNTIVGSLRRVREHGWFWRFHQTDGTGGLVVGALNTGTLASPTVYAGTLAGLTPRPPDSPSRTGVMTLSG